jgi:hypothetical protein
MNAAVAERGAIVPSPRKIKQTRKSGGEAKISQSRSSRKNPPVLFLSTRQMERSELREYIRELENYISRSKGDE